MHSIRFITYFQAVNEALDQLMERDKRVILIGEGVPDPKGIFGTTKGLQKKYGKDRVFDMPVSENGVTGAVIGAAIAGLHPIMVHQRIDFSLLAFDQIVNNAAKWFYMFGGKTPVPVVIRMLIGRGWGQGSQHSQSLQALYGHIPGLKVLMPSNAVDAKGMLVSAVYDNNPVIFIEHRWLHNLKDRVPENLYRKDISKARVIGKGKDITIVASSYMTVEAVKAGEVLKKGGISAEIIDLRCIKPWDKKTIMESVVKTGRLIVVDTGHSSFGLASEIISRTAELILKNLIKPPGRITLPDVPTPTSYISAEKYYPVYTDIVRDSCRQLDWPEEKIRRLVSKNLPAKDLMTDIPDPSFTGPF